MITINERVKFIRTKLGLTQTILGEKLAVTQTYLSQIEKGDKAVTEKILKILCLEFNINEHWLRTGEGEIFIENDDTLLADLSKQYNLTNADEALFRAFLKCSPKERAAIKQLVFRLIDEVNANKELFAEYQRARSAYPIDNLPIAAAVDVFDEKELTYKQKK